MSLGSSRRGGWLWSACVMVTLLGASMASAQQMPPQADPERRDDERARQHFEVGRTYFSEARYDDAAREFAEAFRFSGRAGLLVNLGLSLERALRYQDAVATLERYLELAPEDPRRAEIAERVERLRGFLARAGGAGSREDEPSARDPEPANLPSSPPPAPERGLSPSTLVGVLGLALGGAVGLAAIGTGAGAVAIHGDLSDACVPRDACPAERGGDIQTGAALADASTVLTFVSVGVIAVGAVLLALGLSEDSSEGAVSASFNVGPDGAMVGVGGRW